MLLSSGDSTLATSPYASSKCRPDREVNHVPRKCGVELITTRSDGGHDPVARGGHDVVELVEAGDVSLFGSETSSAARRRASGDDLPPTVPQRDGVHQAQGDRDSTMSGSVEATTAIALKRMSSGILACRMAATRWLATAARSSWLIPRPAWAWSSGRPS
jgi:hypothetical protein